MNEPSTFTWPVRVYYEDTDAGGVVYHCNYLRFCERARTEWLRSLGFDQSALRAQHGVLFVIRSAALDYLRPAVFDDELQVLVRIVKVGRCSFEFAQEIWRNEEKLLTARILVVCVSDPGFKPASIPEPIKIKIQEFQ